MCVRYVDSNIQVQNLVVQFFCVAKVKHPGIVQHANTVMLQD